MGVHYPYSQPATVTAWTTVSTVRTAPVASPEVNWENPPQLLPCCPALLYLLLHILNCFIEQINDDDDDDILPLCPCCRAMRVDA